TPQVHVPHHQGTAGPVVRPLLRHDVLCSGSVVVLTAYLDRKDRSTFEKPHSRPGADMIRYIRAEHLTVRQVHVESCAIRVCLAAPGASSILAQVHENFTSRNTRVIPRWRHLDDLPVDELRFALHLVQILNRSACHGSFLSPFPTITRLYYTRYPRHVLYTK